ncbi:DUF6517 family protein [Haloferax sp. S1W]|uniref:DUF6517 family protein n=1 Tax=Haloferax sp. S1W TaxID=3377110 RepID=UPI0037CB6B9F
MHHARSAIALAFVVVLSGCLGGATFSAEPATIPAAAYEAHGYVHGNTTLVPLSQRVGIGPVSRTVGAEVWVSGYSKTTADDAVTGLAVISSPNVEVVGQSVNPLASLGNRELVRAGLDLLTDAQTLGNISEVNGLREVDAQPVTMLGTEAELVTYAATVVVEPGETTVDGETVPHEGGTVDVRIHLATVEHDGDVIVVVAVHGADVNERDAIVELAGAVEHPGTVERMVEVGGSA